ncbi:MAG: hypothetical protein KA712_15860 [Myxococcales bacterium]|nr:hypothetical protein [Myxococcales bacterium]
MEWVRLKSLARKPPRVWGGTGLAAALALSWALGDDAGAREPERASNGTTVYEPGLIDWEGDLVDPTYSQNPGATLQLGGGVISFANGGLRDRTGLGGYWDVRSAIGLRSVLAIELAYVGSAHSLTGEGIGDAAYLVSHGGEGNIRLNLPVATGRTVLAPFIFGGMGFSHYTLQNSTYDDEMFRSSDTLTTYPVGAGLTFGYEHFAFDARVTYRFTGEQNLLRGDGEGNTPFDALTVGAQLGYLF